MKQIKSRLLKNYLKNYYTITKLYYYYYYYYTITNQTTKAFL